MQNYMTLINNINIQGQGAVIHKELKENSESHD